MSLTCGQCGAENPDDGFFCSKCGAPIRSTFGSTPSGMPPSEPLPTGDPMPPSEPMPPSPNRIYQPLSSETAPEVPNALETPVAPSPQAAPGIVPPPPDAFTAQQTPPSMPPASYQPTYVAPLVPGYAPPPPDGNSSGMGSAYPPPPQTQGWTFAGCIPFGLFGFLNGSTLWGVIGLVGCIPIVYLLHGVYVGIKGREIAWQNRRFSSIDEFEAAMKAWNFWGLITLVAYVILFVLYLVFVIGLATWAAREGAKTP